MSRNKRRVERCGPRSVQCWFELGNGTLVGDKLGAILRQVGKRPCCYYHSCPSNRESRKFEKRELGVTREHHMEVVKSMCLSSVMSELEEGVKQSGIYAR